MSAPTLRSRASCLACGGKMLRTANEDSSEHGVPCKQNPANIFSLAGEGASARIAATAAFVSMAGTGASARIAGYCCLTSYRSVYDCDLYEMHHRTLYISIKLTGRKCTMQRPWSSGSSSSIYKRKSGEATKGEIRIAHGCNHITVP